MRAGLQKRRTVLWVWQKKHRKVGSADALGGIAQTGGDETMWNTGGGSETQVVKTIQWGSGGDKSVKIKQELN